MDEKRTDISFFVGLFTADDEKFEAFQRVGHTSRGFGQG